VKISSHPEAENAFNELGDAEFVINQISMIAKDADRPIHFT
jgi:hypothetical protein